MYVDNNVHNLGAALVKTTGGGGGNGRGLFCCLCVKKN